MGDVSTLHLDGGNRYRIGDEAPALLLIPGGACGEVFDASTFTGWSLEMSGPRRVAGVATYDATTQRVIYTWAANDTSVAGSYLVTLKADDADGNQRTFPSSGGVEVEIFAGYT